MLLETLPMSSSRCCCSAPLFLALALWPLPARAEAPEPRSRTFQFTYAATVTDLKVLAGGCAKQLASMGVADPAQWRHYGDLTLAALRPT